MKTVRISQVDALFANGSYPIEFMFLYRNVLSSRRLRRAMRALSRTFWPAFGDYESGVIRQGRYREEDHFDEVSVGRPLDPSELEGPAGELISRFGQPGLKKLFFLQVTRYADGLVLVPKLDHLAGDGYSYFFLLSALAALTRTPAFPLTSPFVKAMFKPRHGRTALREFRFRAEGPGPAAELGELSFETVEVPRREVQDLVRQAAASDGLRISSNDVLTAMIVDKLAGLRGGPAAAGFRLTIPIDVRRRIKEYGRRHFGNGLMLHTVDLGPGGLAGLPVKEAAARIRGGMPKVTRESYANYLVGLERLIDEKRWDEFLPFNPDRGCLVTNLSKLPADKLDFGTGGPDGIVPLTAERNGAAILSRKGHYVLQIVR